MARFGRDFRGGGEMKSESNCVQMVAGVMGKGVNTSYTPASSDSQVFNKINPFQVFVITAPTVQIHNL